MDQNFFAQTMPLFDSRTNYRTQLFSAAARRRHPPLVAIGASCRGPRSAGSAGTASPAAPFAPAYGLLSCRCGCVGKTPTLTGALKTQEVVPRVRKATPKELFREKDAKLSQLMWEEQVARLELRCSEQEKRVDLALSKPSHRLQRSDVPEWSFEGTPSQRERPHRFPTVPKSKAMHSPQASGAPESLTGRRGKRTSPRDLHHKRDEAQTHNTVLVEPLPTQLCVRDSELLRALQRAEARIYELEMEAPSSKSAVADNRSDSGSKCLQKHNSVGVSELSAAPLTRSTADADQLHPESKPAGYTHLCRNLVIM
ncbi:hypothetical protein ABB37_06687 [Leptomonas pyrrhocoris]|uniref:Uncharacterized protein n=1 Tax=Leptomonas pyrrhocoris TaxID=157538 RepID=A0A0N0VEF8_LEPPY|nr:hypothetical protein ABB37_06687 [Leptomonas pyrrhocoris]KPA77901.1 hypothetical protein ABB37_06687 [Leptomonas pyrrhocoris]|eukprot:XP_015656340.1 hypothetical protein ABB37_06687 [Leptomonas pyrrhocoris]